MRAKGFTLIELITVLILVGILAFTALPRFFDRSAFETRGFRDETLSLLRYAQKAAVAQRRTVCVTVNPTGVALNIASAAGATTCDTALTLPNPNPRGGTGLSANVAGALTPNFAFLAEGGTDRPANVVLSIPGSSGDITVDRVTGYVY